MSEENVQIPDTMPSAQEQIITLAAEFDRLEERIVYLERLLRHEHGRDGKVLFPVDN